MERDIYAMRRKYPFEYAPTAVYAFMLRHKIPRARLRAASGLSDATLYRLLIGEYAGRRATWDRIASALSEMTARPVTVDDFIDPDTLDKPRASWRVVDDVSPFGAFVQARPGLSYLRIARKAGMHHSTISRLARGHMRGTVEGWRAICAALREMTGEIEIQPEQFADLSQLRIRRPRGSR